MIDRFSKDGTDIVAERAGATVIRSLTGRSSARNLGAKSACSPAIIFVDSDMLLSRNLLEICEKCLKEYHVLVIPEISRGEGFWAMCKSMERRTYLGDELVEAVRCFRTDAFFQLGGYDESLEAGEDWDLHYRALMSGLHIGRATSCIIHDEGKLTLTGLMRKKYFYGRTIRKYWKKNGCRAINQTNPYRLVLLTSFRVSRENARYGIGVLVLRTFEILGAIAGLLTSLGG